jgi:hypothetical protein
MVRSDLLSNRCTELAGKWTKLTSGNGAIRPPFQRVYRARRRVVDQVTLPAMFLVRCPVGRLVLLQVLTRVRFLLQLPAFLEA